MKSIRAGAIVINKDNKIALSNENIWGFPRGGIEKSEDYITAAKREVLEETGLKDFIFTKELGIYERYPGHITKDMPGAYPMEIHMFLFVTKYNGELKPEDKGVKEAGWFTYDEALERIVNSIDREFLISKWGEIENTILEEVNKK
jgi:8-oxo-dGTP pyrophosphatase MutT (NUDIX family)